MTAAEHAIENAVSALEHGTEFEAWSKTDLNLEYINATAREVWDMAQWVLYVKCQYCDRKELTGDDRSKTDLCGCAKSKNRG